jgi:hypothetical protein
MRTCPDTSKLTDFSKPADPSALPNPFYYWWRALDAEARAAGQPGVSMQPLSLDPRYAPLSVSRFLNRGIADCLKKTDLYARYDDATRLEHQIKDRWLYHGRAAIYPGALVKIAAFAVADQATNSPSAWGRGALGFSRRLGTDAATRGIRQMMGFGLDAVLGEEPRFLHAPYRGFEDRLNHALMQTYVCRDARLHWTPAIWRIASAVGSEFVSNAWRPKGHGLENAGAGPALQRGGVTLMSDTISDILREFVPLGGRWGTVIRWFE